MRDKNTVVKIVCSYNADYLYVLFFFFILMVAEDGASAERWPETANIPL